MEALRDRCGQLVRDSANVQVQVAEAAITASAQQELVGAWKERGGPFLLDCHGEYLLDSAGKRILYIDTPPGAEAVERYVQERNARSARPPPTPAQQREWEQHMLENWYSVERPQYFQGRRTDVTTFSHAARCGDAQFLQWALEQGLEAQFDWDSVRGYAMSYGREAVLAWAEATR